MTTHRNYIEAPKFAGVPDYLRKLAMMCDVDISLNISSGIIRHTVYYTISGDDAGVDAFRRRVRNAVRRYNK